jgi:hypothetical protein
VLNLECGGENTGIDDRETRKAVQEDLNPTDLEISIETAFFLPANWIDNITFHHCDDIAKMTSADIREVLSISNTAPAQKKKKVKPLIDPAVKNATGITRELYSLLGEGTPPIAFIKQDRFKDKPKLNKKATPW